MRKYRPYFIVRSIEGQRQPCPNKGLSSQELIEMGRRMDVALLARCRAGRAMEIDDEHERWEE